MMTLDVIAGVLIFATLIFIAMIAAQRWMDN